MLIRDLFEFDFMFDDQWVDIVLGTSCGFARTCCLTLWSDISPSAADFVLGMAKRKRTYEYVAQVQALVVAGPEDPQELYLSTRQVRVWQHDE